MVAQNIAFGVIAAMMVLGAIRVVTSNNVVHAALWLVLVLAGAAAQYLLLAAEFVAVTQVLVYVGAVMVLFIFGTMLTRSQIGRERDLNNKSWPLALARRAACSAARSSTSSSTPSATTSSPTDPGHPVRAERERLHLRALPDPVLGALVRPPRRHGRRHRAGPQGLRSSPC